MTDSLPFSAVLGQEDAKLALVLAACDHRIGGVLLRGDKGSAKTTLARGLAALLPGDAPFVELPIGATEDRVVGTLDLTAALMGGEKRFDPGLLHAADGGVLYVDEINLLPDHLVDVLLDVAASGVNRIEREGVSHTHPSRFVLIGSMNPEEGDLRPQLLDRFGLAVDVRTPPTAAERSAALKRRLDFDRDSDAVAAAFAEPDAGIAARLADYRPATLPAGLIDAVAALCSAAGAEGLRADLTICRAATALAGWEGRTLVTAADVRRVAPLALVHRSRRDPLDPTGQDQGAMQQALDQHLGPDDCADDGEEDPTEDDHPPPVGRSGGEPGSEGDRPDRSDPGPPAEPARAAAPPLPPPSGRQLESEAAGRRAPALGPRGRVIGDRRPEGALQGVAVGATVRQAAARRAGETPAAGGSLVEAADLREPVRQHRTSHLIVVTVDASGSMGARQRMETAKGAVIALLRDAYQRRDQVALVAFHGDGARVLLRPTGSVEVARARLTELPTGGRTPLADGIRTALRVATGPAQRHGHVPLLVVITDGRATSGPGDPLEAALGAAAEVRAAGVPAVVIDVEATGAGRPGSRLGLAGRLAAHMGATHVPLSELTPSGVEQAVRRATLQ